MNVPANTWVKIIFDEVQVYLRVRTRIILMTRFYTVVTTLKYSANIFHQYLASSRVLSAEGDSERKECADFSLQKEVSTSVDYWQEK